MMITTHAPRPPPHPKPFDIHPLALLLQAMIAFRAMFGDQIVIHWKDFFMGRDSFGEAFVVLAAGFFQSLKLWLGLFLLLEVICGSNRGKIFGEVVEHERTSSASGAMPHTMKSA